MSSKHELVTVYYKKKVGTELVPSDYQCEVLKDKSISILKHGELLNTFVLGDYAEYDSYNLSYTGQIVGISSKRITIKKPGYTKCAYMSLYEFCWRNYDFDAEETAKKNSDTMNYI